MGTPDLEDNTTTTRRLLSRRSAVGLSLAAAAAALGGAFAGRAGWKAGDGRSALRVLTGSAEGADQTSRAGVSEETHALWLDYDTLGELLDSSDAVVIGTLESVNDVSLPEFGAAGAVQIGISRGQLLTVRVEEILKVSELLKGYAPPIGATIELRHGTVTELDDLESGVKSATVITNGALSLEKGIRVVAFLGLKTNSDGSRRWGFAGEPPLAELNADGTLRFAASSRYVANLADRGLTVAKGGGDSPFAVTLDEVRAAAPKSLDQRVVDPPRTSENRPTSAPQPPSDKPTPQPDQFPTPRP